VGIDEKVSEVTISNRIILQ